MSDTEDISEYDLVEFLNFYVDKYKKLPKDLRESIIDLLVDSESDVIENSTRKDLEDLVRRGSNVVGVGRFEDKRILQIALEEDIPTRYSGELSYYVNYYFSAIDLTKLIKEWMDSCNEI